MQEENDILIQSDNDTNENDDNEADDLELQPEILEEWANAYKADNEDEYNEE